MLIELIKKEFLEHVLGLRFMVSCVLCMGMVIASIFILSVDYRAHLSNYEMNISAFKAEAKSEESYRDLQQHGVSIDARPAPMQIPVYGLARDHKTAHVRSSGTPEFEQEETVNPINVMFPVADVMFVVSTILSLMAFVVSYDAVSGERKSGTLRLLMSFSVPRDLVILAKWVGGYLSLVVPFIFAALIGAVVISASSDIGFRMQDWWAYGLVVLASLLFLAVMFSIGLFTSALCKESSTSIAILILIWVITVLIIPNNSPYVASAFVSVDSPDAVENEVRKTMTAFKRGVLAEYFEKKDKLIKRWKATPPDEKDDLKDDFKELKEDLHHTLDFDAQVIEDDIRGRHKKAMQHQTLLAKQVSRISPVASFVYIVTDLATTGLQRNLHYNEAIMNYQESFRNYIIPKAEVGHGGRRGHGKKKKDKEEDKKKEGLYIGDMPVFKYQPPDLEERVQASILDMGVLGIYTVIFFMAAFVTFITKDLLN